jgi:hypothetical protein
MAGAVVLEAIAIELVLKVRLKRARISFDSLRDKHDHSALYSLVPDLEKQEAEQQYQWIRHPPFRATTLAEALSFSAKVFVKFRYMHGEPPVEASLGEVQPTSELCWMAVIQAVILKSTCMLLPAAFVCRSALLRQPCPAQTVG